MAGTAISPAAWQPSSYVPLLHELPSWTSPLLRLSPAPLAAYPSSVRAFFYGGPADGHQTPQQYACLYIWCASQNVMQTHGQKRHCHEKTGGTNITVRNGMSHCTLAAESPCAFGAAPPASFGGPPFPSSQVLPLHACNASTSVDSGALCQHMQELKDAP